MNVQKFTNDFKLILLFLYFSFNFFDRSISNIALLLCLLLSILDYKVLYESLKNVKRLIISIILFSSWITVSGYINDVPLNELDNYYRFLLLIPLLSVNISVPTMIRVLFASSVFALVHFLLFYFNHSHEGLRYSGTSSVTITYSNIASIMLVLSIYLLSIYNINHRQKIMCVLTALIFIVLIIYSGSRGPMFGIIASILLLIILKRSILLLSVSSVVLIAILSTSNIMSNRIDDLYQLESLEINEIKYRSLRERVYYNKSGTELIKDNYLFGIGPQNLVSNLESQMIKDNIRTVRAQNHLHNEFLDISVKYGVLTLLLLILIYYYFVSLSKNKEISLSIIILLITSQVFQSHFAHHQAITFYIIILVLLMNLKLDDNEKMN